MGIASKIRSSDVSSNNRAPTLPDGPPLPESVQHYECPLTPSNSRASLTDATDLVRDRLTRIVQENGLHRCYPQNKLERAIDRARQIDYDELARQWSIPKEMAYDLSSLALYDIALYCDDSGSMAFEENGERIDDLQIIVSKVAGIAALFDEDGIVVRFMNSEQQGNGITQASQAESLVKSIRYGGTTPLGTNLKKKVLDPFVVQQIYQNNLDKPVLVIIVTDGCPVGEPRQTLKSVIRNTVQICARSCACERMVGFQIAQVGKDQKAQQFLEEIDNDPDVGHLIDATSYYELEHQEMLRKGVELTPELWLVKMMLGGIDRSYDDVDE